MPRATKDVYDALRPIHTLCKIAGIVSYSPKPLNRQRAKTVRRYKVTLPDILVTLVPFAILMVVFAIGINTCEREYDILIRAITAVMQRYCNVFIYLACYCGSLVHGRKFTKATRLLFKYDRYLLENGPVSSYESARARVRFILLVALSANLIMIGIDTYDTLARSTPGFCMLLYVCSYTTTVFVECQLFVVVTELRVRLAALKMKINDALNGRRESRRVANELNVCCTIYGVLIEAGGLLNRYYDVQIAMKLFISFLFVLSALFYFTTDLAIGPDIGYLFDYFAFVYDIALNLTEVYFIFYVFAKATGEIDGIKTVLYEFRDNHEKQIRKMVALMLWQTYKVRFDFDLFHAHRLDWSTFFKFLSGILTYLLILLQFNEFFVDD